LLRRRHLGFVFQDSQLFERMTAWESIALPLRIRGASSRSCRQRAGELLEALGLSGRAEQRTEQLSGGEQQRVAVARALAASPDLLIADEPLSGADPDSADLIAGLLDQARRNGAGLLVASHHPLFRERAHRRVVLGGV
jgi:predicted ABC-type transport system involved in lysophospholipase L1 biosynthesis ATPase subunit